MRPKSLAIATLVALGISLLGCKADAPGKIETKVMQETKELAIGGKDWTNPVPDNEDAQKSGAQHFQHHCQICHGLDGQNTGVPFAHKMSPEVADLSAPEIQKYTDGQLKWIVENGIRLTGMPGWKGILEDDEMWKIVRYIRHLPAKGSLGDPAVFKEEKQEHQHSERDKH
jgi:mono/diheme cytochrome c family protein